MLMLSILEQRVQLAHHGLTLRQLRFHLSLLGHLWRPFLGRLGARLELWGDLRRVDFTFHMYSFFSRIFSLFFVMFRLNFADLNWRVFKNLELLLSQLAELPIGRNKRTMDALDVILKWGVPREYTLAKDAFEGPELHVDALRMIF